MLGEEVDVLNWTTEDEKEYIDYLFMTESWATLKRYPETIRLRRWDEEVDVEEIALYATRRARDVAFIEARGGRKNA